MTGPVSRPPMRRDRRGATAVEFALLAPVFFTMLFGIVESARMLWIRQTINEVAFSTARCTSVSAACETPASQSDYAVSRARAYGYSIAAADVAIEPNTTCKATGGMVKVTIATRFHSPAAGLLPGLPSSVTGTGCFPAL